MLQIWIFLVFLQRLYGEEETELNLDDYLIDWRVKYRIPNWFYGTSRPFQQSAVLIPLLLFSFEFNETFGHTPLLNMSKFKRGLGIKYPCQRVELNKVLKYIEQKGVSLVTELHIMPYGWGIRDKYGKAKVLQSTGQLQLIKELQTAPVITEIYLQGLDNYGGEIYDGRFCGMAKELSLRKIAVAVIGMKKDIFGNYYFEALTSWSNNWGYNGAIKIKINAEEDEDGNVRLGNDKNGKGVCDIAEKFHMIIFSK
eukprot:GAHX01002253.1.p1 GENE.GAHX01002253.1~~GAHX01002253.1.p1  ORF type:complete len:254 (+),score=31.48 GAHX01002253.1:1620-2381(+)